MHVAAGKAMYSIWLLDSGSYCMVVGRGVVGCCWVMASGEENICRVVHLFGVAWSKIEMKRYNLNPQPVDPSRRLVQYCHTDS